MNLAFLYEYFRDFKLEYLTYNEKDGSEWAYIRNPEFEEAIKVYYYPNDYYKYYLSFSTQHLDTNETSEIIKYAELFANAELAAIEFYDDGIDRFGGHIETAFLDELTYDKLRAYFGYYNLDISKLTFRVYAWEKRYCFEGFFQKDSAGVVKIIKKSMDNIKNEIAKE